jgi:hypothetical protein
LKALGISANPEWSESGVLQLFSPMIEFVAQGWLHTRYLRTLVPTVIDNYVEVEERETACNEVGTYLDQLSKFKSPDKEEEASSMLNFVITFE